MLNSVNRPSDTTHPGNKNFKCIPECAAEENGFFDCVLQPDVIVPARFFSGDWGALSFEDEYDLVLSSETLYCAESIPKLVDLIYVSLKDAGTALIAAKSNYFGCTGGLEQFKEAIRDRFDFSVVYSNSEFVRREILLMKKKT